MGLELQHHAFAIDGHNVFGMGNVHGLIHFHGEGDGLSSQPADGRLRAAGAFRSHTIIRATQVRPRFNSAPVTSTFLSAHPKEPRFHSTRGQ